MELSGILTVQSQCVCVSRSALSLNKLLCRHFIHFIGAKLFLNSQHTFVCYFIFLVFIVYLYTIFVPLDNDVRESHNHNHSRSRDRNHNHNHNRNRNHRKIIVIVIVIIIIIVIIMKRYRV